MQSEPALVRYGSLACLVFQNTFLVVFMHASRISSGADGLYAASTAVVSMEVIKLFCNLVAVTNERGLSGLLTGLQAEIIQQPQEMLKVAVPSVLYCVQNNLLYYALSHLDAATYQVGYQLKILTTALFSYLMLNKALSSAQLVSLVLLTIGVSAAQLSSSQSSNGENSLLGGMAVVLAAGISGFAGVYMEKLMKHAPTSLWMRNVQLSLSSIPFALLGVCMSGEWPQVRDKGFFFGYNRMVLAVILLQATGGLIVAVVMKYADNILKGFAASFSIVTASILSYFMFNFKPSLLFVLGAALVIVSAYIYSKYPVKKEEGASNKPNTARQRAAIAATANRYVEV